MVTDRLRRWLASLPTKAVFVCVVALLVVSGSSFVLFDNWTATAAPDEITDRATLTVSTGAIFPHLLEGGQVCATKIEPDVNRVIVTNATLKHVDIYLGDEGGVRSHISIPAGEVNGGLVIYTNGENLLVDTLSRLGICLPPGLPVPLPTTLEAYYLGAENLQTTDIELSTGGDAPEPSGPSLQQVLDATNTSPTDLGITKTTNNSSGDDNTTTWKLTNNTTTPKQSTTTPTPNTTTSPKQSTTTPMPNTTTPTPNTTTSPTPNTTPTPTPNTTTLTPDTTATRTPTQTKTPPTTQGIPPTTQSKTTTQPTTTQPTTQDTTTPTTTASITQPTATTTAVEPTSTETVPTQDANQSGDSTTTTQTPTPNEQSTSTQTTDTGSTILNPVTGVIDYVLPGPENRQKTATENTTTTGTDT